MLKARVVLRDMEGFDAQFLEVRKAIDTNLRETATFVRDDAKATSTFIDRTGNLRDSIRMRKSKFEGGGFIVYASGSGTKKGYHASLVEFGHVLIAWGRITGRRVAPRPFMRQALDKGYRHAVSLFRGNK